MTTPSTQGTCLHVICGGIYWHVLNRAATNSLVVSCHMSAKQKCVIFQQPTDIPLHPLKTTMYKFIHHDDTHQYDKKKTKPHRHVACASSFSKQRFFQRSFWVEDAPYRAAHSWCLESKDECMLPNHQVRHMEGCQSLLLVAEHAGQSARLSTCLPKQFVWECTPEFLFIYSFDFGCTTIWYVLYVLSLSWRVHACLHRDSAKWLTSFPLLWLTNIPTVAWPKSTPGR